MIRDINIASYSIEDQRQYEPPEQTLELSVHGGVASLRINRLNDAGDIEAIEGTIDVPARSLLRALQVGVDDDAAGGMST